MNLSAHAGNLRYALRSLRRSPGFLVLTVATLVLAIGVNAVRALVREVAPEAPMYRVLTMAGLAADSMVQLSFTMLTLGIASTLAIVLGAVGLFGVLSFVVAERTRESGVRMAFGAEAGQVRRLVLWQGARVAGVGVALGAVVAVAVTRALDRLLYGVGARPRHLRGHGRGDGGGGAARELPAGAPRVERGSDGGAADRVTSAGLGAKTSNLEAVLASQG